MVLNFVRCVLAVSAPVLVLGGCATSHWESEFRRAGPPAAAL